MSMLLSRFKNVKVKVEHKQCGPARSYIHGVIEYEYNCSPSVWAKKVIATLHGFEYFHINEIEVFASRGATEESCGNPSCGSGNGKPGQTQLQSGKSSVLSISGTLKVTKHI